MVTLSDRPVVVNDIKDYLATRSDFAFEMEVAQKLRGLGCEDLSHGGTYSDPVQDKKRQYDIRCYRQVGDQFVNVSAECKNIQQNFPLVLHRSRRTRGQAFHDLVAVRSTDGVSPPVAMCVVIPAPFSIYREDELVGRSFDQVGRNANRNGEFVSGDERVFDKIQQALHSSYDMIKIGFKFAAPDRSVAVLPILVVPNDTLWIVDYQDDGRIKGDPRLASRASYFAGYEFAMSKVRSMPFKLSHLEVATVSGLDDLFAEWTGSKGRSAFELSHARTR